MILHNRVNRKELRDRIAENPEKRVTLSFYKYAKISDPGNFRDILYAVWDRLRILGRAYVAKEGINAQISVPEANFEAFKDNLYSWPFLDRVRLNIAVEQDDKSFFKLTIKVKHKIVADGLDDSTFDVTNSGKHLDAESFNELIEDPQTVVVDMRNHYESEVGHFKGAITPDVDTFREALEVVGDMLSEDKDKNIVMYCTGGIRCEKASAYYKHHGFQNVYQLDGGIIEYTREAKNKGLPNHFLGKNFVFDERLGERISGEVISRCHQCGEPCDTHTNCINDACHLLFIQCEKCAAVYEGCCSEDCREVIHLPEEKQREIRRGVNKGRQVYKKGRSEKLIYKH